MRINFFKVMICFGMLLLLTNSVAFAEWGRPSKSEVKEYIDTFVSVGLYAVPYSEPLSVLLASPEITRMGLHTWVNAQQQKVWLDYEDALARDAEKEELIRLIDKANRYQAVYTCLFQNDCTRLRQIEDKDRKREASPGSKPMAGEQPGADMANFSGTWQCPGRGVLTIEQDEMLITAHFSGKNSGDHWGNTGRKGGSHSGTVRGQTATINGNYGDGTRGDETITLSADGKSFSGTWNWYRGDQKLGSGTWGCHR